MERNETHLKRGTRQEEHDKDYTQHSKQHEASHLAQSELHFSDSKLNEARSTKRSRSDFKK